MVRIISGAVMAAVVLALVLYGPEYAIWAAIVVVGGIALWEFREVSDKMGYRAPSWLIFPLGVYFAFSGTLLKQIDLPLVLSLALVGGLAVFLFLPGSREGLGRWALGLGGAIYIGMPFNYYLLLLHGDTGRLWLLFTLMAAVLSDIGALVVGMAAGRTPFFASISPKKTLEGAFAGVLLAALVMLLGELVGLRVGTWQAILIGLAIGVSAEAGDLVESQMKRVAGVKDSSNLIPGHGGVLDRIDSILFPPIVVFVLARLLGVLG